MSNKSLPVGSAERAVSANGLDARGGSDGRIPLAYRAHGVPVIDTEHALLASVEARLTDEVWGLIRSLSEFSRRTQLIGKEAPESADFCQVITTFLGLSSLQFASALSNSMVRGIFRDGGSQYLTELGLNVKDLFREVDLDGQRFLAVALTDKRLGEVDGDGKRGDD